MQFILRNSEDELEQESSIPRSRQQLCFHSE